MIVPIASKKHGSSTVKTNRTPVSTPTLPKPPNRLTSPIRPKSGVATGLPGQVGVVRPQDGTSATALMTTATTVIATIERSEEHTSELQSRLHLVCRLLL